jgi:hypothetical protein
MHFGIAGLTGTSEISFLILVAATAASASLVVFLAGFFWFRHEQRRLQRKLLEAIAQSARASDQLFVTDEDASITSELVAQIRVRRGKQVISVLEANGKRFIHVEGDLSAPERARMVRYLKSEGFMS